LSGIIFGSTVSGLGVVGEIRTLTDTPQDASLSEHFYNLKLAPASIPTPRLGNMYTAKPRLSNRQRWGMLLILVGLPYIRARADDAYERWSTQNDPELMLADQGPPLTRLQKLFVSLYPVGVTVFEGTLLAYDFAYLFNKTDAYRPWHKWLGVRVQRAMDDDDGKGGLWSKLPPLLPPLLLALKFAQWWYSPTSPRSLPGATQASTSLHTSVRPPRPLPILPDSGILTPPTTPPPGEQPDAQAYSIDVTGYGHCPICKGKWANPAILPSGWVVCWRCGWDAIAGEGEAGEAGKGRCPITGVEVRPEDLRRVLV